MWPRGSAVQTARSCPGDELADQLIPMWSRPASPTSSSCRLPSIRSIHPGAIEDDGPLRADSPLRRSGGFARFVDGAHRAGIGAILDWVPAHFPTGRIRSGAFRRHALYEHSDPRQGFHPDWNTAIYNFGRREVLSYLVNNALYWSEAFHLDGLRVDAVASMLYLDYSRKQGEWILNKQGGAAKTWRPSASSRT